MQTDQAAGNRIVVPDRAAKVVATVSVGTTATGPRIAAAVDLPVGAAAQIGPPATYTTELPAKASHDPNLGGWVAPGMPDLR